MQAADARRLSAYQIFSFACCIYQTIRLHGRHNELAVVLMQLIVCCRLSSALSSSAAALLGNPPERHSTESQGISCEVHQCHAAPASKGYVRASGILCRCEDRNAGNFCVCYAEVLPPSADMRTGTGEVPREPPLGFRLLISLMMTAFSSLNCSSPVCAGVRLSVAVLKVSAHAPLWQSRRSAEGGMAVTGLPSVVTLRGHSSGWLNVARATCIE